MDGIYLEFCNSFVTVSHSIGNAELGIHDWITSLNHHRLTEFGKDLLSLPSPTSLFKKGQVKQVAQDPVQSGF